MDSVRESTRAVLGVVGARVGEVEALGHLEVHLHRAELPGAAQRVGHVQVDLGPVEGAVALVDRVLEALVLERARQQRLRLVPLRVVADPVLGPR
jgi:hypothetical protein